MVSCDESNSHNDLNVFLKSTIVKSDSIIDIDLRKHQDDLVRYAENQISFDLCDKSYFTGSIEDGSDVILFPSFLTKKCNPPNLQHKVITILINSSDQTLIESEVISSNISIQDKIVEISKAYTEDDLKPIRTLYLFQWDKATSPEKLKERTIQTLHGVKEFYDLLAYEEYGKEYSGLNSKEIEEFNLDYKFKVGFSGSQCIVPPPPPPPAL